MKIIKESRDYMNSNADYSRKKLENIRGKYKGKPRKTRKLIGRVKS